ncbi:hypothetical protein CP500_017440 [Tychonema bourrellyi FEM_GT703]|uniref:Uncharacterized protein n=1 Tax=Tychonema bourrellyi FEM_GT703 TaxID=2040638 RepID=A0A2G4EXD2_9CYAN|nr:hypothetical protein CP500_017440 [Tychonema bourrellyi FEM_GT703]
MLLIQKIAVPAKTWKVIEVLDRQGLGVRQSCERYLMTWVCLGRPSLSDDLGFSWMGAATAPQSKNDTNVAFGVR